jgi:hypothetical protein
MSMTIKVKKKFVNENIECMHVYIHMYTYIVYTVKTIGNFHLFEVSFKISQ